MPAGEGPGLTALTLTRELALYSLGGPGEGAVPFSPASYSRYKYG